MSEPSQDTKDLLAELDAEFGKKPRERQRSRGAQVKDEDVVKRLSSAEFQLTRMDFDSFEEWEAYREMLIANQLSKNMDWRPSWIPECRITHVVRQHCETCGNNVDFIGGEFIRFKSKRERAVITRRAEVVSDLWHYGYGGKPLEDVIEYHYQVVHRCPGCILVEQVALEIWDGLVEQHPQQAEIPEVKAAPKAPGVPTTGQALKDLIHRPFGEKKVSGNVLDIKL